MVTTLPINFPKNKRFAVCLTFDYDTLSVWVGALKQTTPTAISRGEFGLVGVERLLDLLEKYSIKSSWYAPGYDVEAHPDVIKEIFRKGHEIGHHGYLHETPVNLKLEEEKVVIERGIKAIEGAIGERPKGYRSPAWDLSPNTADLLIQAGFVYDSSMMAHDYLPYKVRTGDVPDQNGFRFGCETNLVEIPVYWGLDDYPHFEFLADHLGSGLRAGSAVLENWISDFDYMYNNLKQGVYNICFHPFITGRGHRIVALEKLIEHIINKEGIWFARAIDVARACVV
jgi:peptidoglycan/xylan/chitin deacetylase (PgdA/CDA1 family)